MKADQLLRLERNWEERRMELLRELRRPCNVWGRNPRTRGIPYTASVQLLSV